MFAAMVNAAASHFVEQDDVHNGSVSHPATVVFPPALAVAQALGSSGRELLTAAVAGYERPCAECLRMSTRLVKRFPHSAALCEQEGVHHPADDEEIHLFGEMPSTSIFLETLGPPTIAATGRCGASRANFVHRSARRCGRKAEERTPQSRTLAPMQRRRVGLQQLGGQVRAWLGEQTDIPRLGRCSLRVPQYDLVLAPCFGADGGAASERHCFMKAFFVLPSDRYMALWARQSCLAFSPALVSGLGNTPKDRDTQTSNHTKADHR